MSNVELENLMKTIDSISNIDTIEEKYVKLKLINDEIDNILKQIRGKCETWKQIDSYENYSVSSFGRVR